VSRQARKISRGIREPQLRHPFSAVRRTDDATGWREDSKNAAPSPSAMVATWTQHFSPRVTIRSSPNAGRHRRQAATRKEDGRPPQFYAHRFSGSDWHI